MFDVQDELKKLPPKPGVYIMHDERDTIIYVGKAVNLHNRVRSYFRKIVGRGPQIDQMVKQIEYIVTDSELEALILENNLIKEHRPKYNTMLKDDKTYPYIKVTVGEPYPRILFARRQQKDKARYFGPYTSAQAVKSTIELLNRMYGLRDCSRVLPRDFGKERPCLNLHMERCCAPCTGEVTEEEYRKRVDMALEFLSGRYDPIIRDLTQKMTEASEAMEFEKAIRYRDLLNDVQQVAQKQKMSENLGENRDILGIAVDNSSPDSDGVVQTFFLRDGKLIGREHFYMTHVAGRKKSDILSEFIKQFYGGTPSIPREIFLPCELEDRELLEQWLTAVKGSKVVLRVPVKGQKEKLVELANTNAGLVLDKDRERLKREEGRTIGAVREIEQLLGLKKADRMEAFDITVSGPNDYACMKEVLTRRFRHGMDELRELDRSLIDKEFGSFTRFPDVLMMDGGRGQVNIALQVLDELGLHIPVCGMVKDDHHRTRGLYYNNIEIPIDRSSEAFKLITRIQDEAHRFAVEYHRSLRGKAQTSSALEEIPGIGPARKKALMREFGSIAEIAAADVERLAQVPEITAGAAEEIYRYFHKEKEVPAEDSGGGDRTADN